jgi:hypothetical protein
MFKLNRAHIATTLLALGVLGSECCPAAVRIEGQVQAVGAQRSCRGLQSPATTGS